MAWKIARECESSRSARSIAQSSGRCARAAQSSSAGWRFRAPHLHTGHYALKPFAKIFLWDMDALLETTLCISMVRRLRFQSARFYKREIQVFIIQKVNCFNMLKIRNNLLQLSCKKIKIHYLVLMLEFLTIIWNENTQRIYIFTVI